MTHPPGETREDELTDMLALTRLEAWTRKESMYGISSNSLQADVLTLVAMVRRALGEPRVSPAPEVERRLEAIISAAIALGRSRSVAGVEEARNLDGMRRDFLAELGRVSPAPQQTVTPEEAEADDGCAVAVGGEFMETTVASFRRRCKLLIEEEQEKPLPNNALIATLCDGVRLTREYLSLAREPLASVSPAQPSEEARKAFQRIEDQFGSFTDGGDAMLEEEFDLLRATLGIPALDEFGGSSPKEGNPAAPGDREPQTKRTP